MSKLKGKKCLITAAAHGIGLASAKAFAAAGAEVIASDIDQKGLEELLGIDGIKTRRLDVLRQEDIEKTHNEIGEIDILFNCAGIVHAGDIVDSSEEELDFAVDLNIKAMIRTIKTFLPGMINKGDGAIINMASVVSSITGAPNRFIYTTTKAAVIGLTKSVAADYVGQGIRCNAICPGTVDTPSLHERLRAQGDYQQALAQFIARQPIGRLGKPEEIADLAVYLAGATYTTGQAHVIDGGWNI
ncbi:2-keto-3-deoxy-L-fuconate dehydrogenase [hydrothermal vent metagenome]|uniref:2-keto-3-deoxy-L-fuconate dehydrogenase n=1 Tax=hydrothermal vent metagenome TaxID=652676 RepID=A0A3B0TP60_9ZZZZ